MIHCQCLQVMQNVKDKIDDTRRFGNKFYII